MCGAGCPQPAPHDAVEHVLVSTPEEAEAAQFRGSPTVLVDGLDPFADRDAQSGSRASCTGPRKVWPGHPRSKSCWRSSGETAAAPSGPTCRRSDVRMLRARPAPCGGGGAGQHAGGVHLPTLRSVGSRPSPA